MSMVLMATIVLSVEAGLSCVSSLSKAVGGPSPVGGKTPAFSSEPDNYHIAGGPIPRARSVVLLWCGEHVPKRETAVRIHGEVDTICRYVHHVLFALFYVFFCVLIWCIFLRMLTLVVDNSVGPSDGRHLGRAVPN